MIAYFVNTNQWQNPQSLGCRSDSRSFRIILAPPRGSCNISRSRVATFFRFFFARACLRGAIRSRCKREYQPEMLKTPPGPRISWQRGTTTKRCAFLRSIARWQVSRRNEHAPIFPNFFLLAFFPSLTELFRGLRRNLPAASPQSRFFSVRRTFVSPRANAISVRSLSLLRFLR